MSNKKKWLELGLVIKNTKKADGTPIPPKDQKFTFKLSDEVHKVLLDAGYEVSQYGVMKTPVEEVEGLIKAGQIGEDKMEERREAAKNATSWLNRKVSLPPPKEAQD